MRIFLLLTLLPLNLMCQQHIQAEVTMQQLNNKKKIEIKKNIYYNINGDMVIHFTSPEEYYFYTNSFGEAKIYNPSKNEVALVNDESVSSENEMLYYFLSGQYEDMGLGKAGFTLQSTTYDEQYLVRTYMPPSTLAKKLQKAQIVYDNYLPIYCVFFSPNGKAIRKCYYSKYYTSDQFIFPQRITYISCPNDTDSIIGLETYNNVRIGNQLFDKEIFKIPDNAKLIKSK